MYTKIVKLVNGNVQLQNASNEAIKTMNPQANLELLNNNKGVRIQHWQGENTDILLSELDFTRIDPAADVAFSGSSKDLMDLLGEFFFFKPVSGGSSVEQYANLAAFPASGESDVIYIAEDTNFTYRWNGAAYTLIGDGGGTSPYIVEQAYTATSITVNTVVYTYPIADGETVGIRVENVARRNTAQTGAYSEDVVFAQRTGASTVLAVSDNSFNSTSYSVGVSFSVSGTDVQVICTISGGIPISHRGFIRIIQL